MSYTRPPQSVLAGRGLTQNPPPTAFAPSGVVKMTIDSDIAKTSSLGVIQVGSGLSITSAGVLSATGGNSLINVYLTAVNYTATVTDYYIGATDDDVIITLPLGIVGKVYIVKNQSTGNIVVRGTGIQKIDEASTKTLGRDASLIVVFDGSRWNLI